MSEKWCQSCAMPMNDEMYGNNSDSSKNGDYCKYCFENGKFTQECTMEEMAEICVPHMTKQGMSEDEARKIMKDCLPKLKRWQETSKQKANVVVKNKKGGFLNNEQIRTLSHDG